MTPSRETLFSKCQFARDSQWTETANDGNSTMRLPSPLPSLPRQNGTRCIFATNMMDCPDGSFRWKKKGIVQYFVSIVYSTDKLRTLWMGSSRLKCNLFSNYDATNEKGEKIRLKYEDINCDTRAKTNRKWWINFSRRISFLKKRRIIKNFEEIFNNWSLTK